jgi:hypothetical protein
MPADEKVAASPAPRSVRRPAREPPPPASYACNCAQRPHPEIPDELPDSRVSPKFRGTTGPGQAKTTGMEFFCYHRDRPGSLALRDELLEQH